ncbi:GNAT family N-acetyltransferase/peptidase C39 family protein [Alteromonas facilis]|uniref:GNAT family N-acetyltransferase/peptidase C39 family protein n=1 Tax=Alteromonas facilis TaxID=2048004 RepID=UPI000C282FFD|nr:GNAT family N-acetyltransferase/peptidase C39 family protein [Alteromonas facilis]
MTTSQHISFRAATKTDVPQLVALENEAFDSDRLSAKRFKHWVGADNRVFLVAEADGQLMGYGLVLLRKGTQLARLYSIAISQRSRGAGLGARLLQELEVAAMQAGRLFMRLEVAENNDAAIALYKRAGYEPFGVYAEYYANNIDAIRMQKPIKQLAVQPLLPCYPWYRQTTEFTCGPSALMMAMHSIDDTIPLSQALELALWREATSIYMTSGHGGCHPYGLALSAYRRNFMVDVYVSYAHGLFVDGVRSTEKKHIMTVVEDTFIDEMADTQIHLHETTPTLDDIKDFLSKGRAVVGLISTYHLSNSKTPHWVCITQVDDSCFYLHDPDVETESTNPLEYQHIPICNQDFLKMSGYGKQKLRAFIVIHQA